MSDASIIVATFGDESVWRPLADRAIASAEAQTVPAQVIYRHSDTLQHARNEGAEEADGEWLVFLDADDTLDPHYVEGILDGDGDLRQPKTLGVYPNARQDPEPVFIPPKRSFREGNWLVVGTGVRRKFFDVVGGFGPEELYEDWSLWARCWIEGAEVGQAPDAIYHVTVNPEGTSRNTPGRDKQIYWFNDISRRLGATARQKGLPW